MAVYLLIFAVILFWGAKAAKRGEFNEDFLSLKVSKGIQGFFAICIITHHFSQQYIYVGEGTGALTLFGLIGFLFVGVFFFFSGYGLFKSYKTKPGYLDGFLRKRLPVVLVPLYVINTIFTIIVLVSKGTVYNDMNPLLIGMDNILFRITTFLGITLMNSNAWYMVTIAIFYLVFYFTFINSRNEDDSLKIMAVFSVIYVIAGIFAGHGILWLQGEWWYNSSMLFIVGMYTAKNEEKILVFIKKKYVLLVTVCTISTVIMTVAAICATAMISYYRPGLHGKVCSVICLFCETLATALFVSLVLMITMKIRLNNSILDFLGRIALEVYLVHRFFIVSLNSRYVTVPSKILYLALIYVFTIISAVILHKIDGAIVQFIKGNKVKVNHIPYDAGEK